MLSVILKGCFFDPGVQLKRIRGAESISAPISVPVSFLADMDGADMDGADMESAPTLFGD